MKLYELLTKLHNIDEVDAKVEVEVDGSYDWHEITHLIGPRFTPLGEIIFTIRVDRGHNELSR